jgi:UDP-3-O-[3-hydroxymyristoyl] glucosamine N-acyltransferase
VKLRELASLIHGEIIGDESIEITGASGIREAKEGDITFLSARKFLKDLAGSGASCVIVSEPLPEIPVTQVKVPNPQLAYAKLLEHFYVKRHAPAGVSADAYISGTARIAEGVSVYPFCYISAGVSLGKGTVVYPHVFIGEDSAIGEDCILHPNVTVREKVRIGDRVIIHSGTVIGSDGFGYVFDQGVHHKIPQVGGVIVADDVEIGANVSIDRATTGNTMIGSGTKIDNLVQIAHNVKIGKNSLIISQVGIAGSSEIGDYVTLAGQVGVADHTHIESETIFGAQSGAMGHVTKGIYSGSPGMPHREWLKARAVFAKLPELQRKVRELEAKIRELEKEES